MDRFKIVAFALLLLVACGDSPHGAPPKMPEQPKRIPPVPDVTITEPLPVGGNVKAPVVISRVEPDYAACTGKTMSGLTVLETVIDTEGNVTSVKFIKSAHPCLERPMIDAMKKWRFKPGTLDGKPVPVRFDMTVFIHYR